MGRVCEAEAALYQTVSDLTGLKCPATPEIMVKLGNPELAFQVSLMACNGVGLARTEFIIATSSRDRPTLFDASKSSRGFLPAARSDWRTDDADISTVPRSSKDRIP